MARNDCMLPGNRGLDYSSNVDVVNVYIKLCIEI